VVEVKLKKSIDVEKLGVTKRINDYTGKTQYHAGDILKKLEKNALDFEAFSTDTLLSLLSSMLDFQPKIGNF